MEPLEQTIIFLGVMLGGFIRAYIGWLNAQAEGEEWNLAKFLSTMLSAFMVAVGTFITFYLKVWELEFSVFLFFFAVATGAGFDDLIKGINKASNRDKNPATKPKDSINPDENNT